MARFRRRMRPKIRWAWTGISASEVILSSGRTVFSIVEPVTFSTVADVTVERVLIDLNLTYRNIEESTPVLGDPMFVTAVLTVVPTNTVEAPITTGLPQPLSGDIDDTQKRVMWTKWFVMPPLANSLNAITAQGTMGAYQFGMSNTAADNNPCNGGALFNNGHPFDVGVRRKLGGDMALVLSMEASTFNDVELELNVDVYARALLRIGRK